MSALLIVLLLLLLLALATAGAVVRSARHLWLRRWVEQRLRGEAAGEVPLERARHLLSACALASAVVILALGAALDWGAWRSVPSAAITVAVVLLGLGVLGDVIPRALGRHQPGRLIGFSARLLRAAELLSAPVRAAGVLLLEGVRRTDRHTPAAQREAVVAALRAAELDRLATREERTIISGVVGFGARQARDIMTPRAEIFGLRQDTPPAELAGRIAASAYSRVPVYGDSIDAIAGMVHAFDVLRAGAEAAPLRRVLFVAPEQPCSVLLFEMLRGSDHLAIVRDAFGRTAGLITIEDLLEELVGEIQDEHDEPLSERRPARAALPEERPLAGRGSG